MDTNEDAVRATRGYVACDARLPQRPVGLLCFGRLSLRPAMAERPREDSGEADENETEADDCQPGPRVGCTRLDESDHKARTSHQVDGDDEQATNG